MTATPGTITMRKGKWRVFTARKGYRPQWEPFNAEWLVRLIETDFIAPISDARKAVCVEWIRMLRDEQFEAVGHEMKAVSECMKGKFADTVKAWSGFLRTTTMISHVKCGV